MLPSAAPRDDLARVSTDPWGLPARASMPPRATSASHVVLRVGALAAAATLGALVGFGVRAGGAAQLLSAGGLALRGLPDVVSPDRGIGIATIAGTLQHAAVVLAWSAAFVAIAARWRVARGVVAAVLFAAVAWAVDGRLPTALRVAAGVPDPAQRVVLFALLAGALGIGTRLAFPRGASPATESTGTPP